MGVKPTAKSGIAALLAVVVVLACAAAGVGAWALARGRSPLHPEISAYSHGQLTRVGPYRYCKVLDLNDCQNPQAQGELRVNARDPVQLSVPPAIGRAPWWLLRVYQDAVNPDDHLLPAGQPAGGHHSDRRSEAGTADGNRHPVDDCRRRPSRPLHGVPHAEWSVRTVWG